MAGEPRGTYILVDGQWRPGVTVKGSKGNPGAPGVGSPGPRGTAAAGVVVSPTAPPNPVPWETVWLDPTGANPAQPPIRAIGASGEPGFQNGWLNFESGAEPAFFTKVRDLVHLRGVIKSGTVGAVPAFTLPEGFRPTKPSAAVTSGVIFSVLSNGALGRVTVMHNGEVRIEAPSSNAWVALSGITFLAAT